MGVSKSNTIQSTNQAGCPVSELCMFACQCQAVFLFGERLGLLGTVGLLNKKQTN